MRLCFILLCLYLFCVPTYGQAFKSYEQKIGSSPVSFKMVTIPSGKFQMGSKSIMADSDETPVQEIELTSFWLGEHEVTFAEWDVYRHDPYSR